MSSASSALASRWYGTDIAIMVRRGDLIALIDDILHMYMLIVFYVTL